MSIALNPFPIDGTDKFFDCEYCSLEFSSRHDRIQHTVSHLKSKLCTTCRKLLLCINGDWYELHVSPSCEKQNDFQHQSIVDTGEIESQASEIVFDSKHVPKPEVNNSDSSDAIDNDYGTIDSPSATPEPPNIEVNTLPLVVESLAKLKTNLTISRTRVKKSPVNKPPDISHEKVEKVIKPIKQPVKKCTKQILDKTVFMDHRPPGACTCDICEKTLASYTTLRSHILKQHILRKERVSCNECGATFASPGNFKLHKKIHLESKAYVCTYCGKGFNQMSGLKEHTNRHIGQRPHKCSYCEKSFFRRTTLTAHIRTHTGHKPFKCDIDNCDRAYMFDIDLKRHKYSVHGIYTKKHFCPICEKVYPENKLLKKHLQSHSNAQFGST